jgi:PST family polysaccharide transporter
MSPSAPNKNAPAIAPTQGKPESEDGDGAAKQSYREILKSSALIGVSQVLSIGIGIIRTKAMAVMLGPAGFGLMAVFMSVADLIRSVAEMGINNSGVRQIAAAVGTEDMERIARTVTVLRKTTIVLGILGAGLTIVLSLPLSELTFGTNEKAGALALLSLAVLFKLVADGQGALIQGMRRISDLAKIGVLGAFFGTAMSIGCVYFLGEEGVVFAVISIAAMSLLTSWWYSRKVRIQVPVMKTAEVRQEAVALLKLGSAFMASAVMMMGAAYVVRIMILRMEGLDAAGFYQAAWTLGGLYVGIILQAMGADFYPRLTAVARDNTQVNRLANEQTHVSLLLAGPGVIATLTLAPLLMVLFYSSEFGAATELLRWICLGMTLRIISWPIGYIIVAKAEKTLFVMTELAWVVVSLSLAWICVKHFGLNGAGLAFFGSYVFHALMIYLVVRRLSDFRWSPINRKTGILFLASIAIVFCGFYLLPTSVAVAVGILAAILSGFYSARVLLSVYPLKQFPPFAQRIIALVRLAP